MAKNIYYLSAEEVSHYQYMLNNGYAHEIVDTGAQRYLVFEVVGKAGLGIAWPTISGKIDGAHSELDTILEPDSRLHRLLVNALKTKTFKGFLFPRYAG